ncbi:MAG: TIGR04282 family arsenosugar biosynthesis glycosyltransferase [Pseudonocardia sp.]|uniref:TIGR04282 family arsenosugar biosynthesis glycosyltransferase n=1 Tax=Pseudonocardia sp. TaxID=60912 RepID=UPI001ACEC8AF|nr:TIGR04282 family arsenosugar biosynthesis glycosyltransferase [Pseudonocardia sp.]MBN9098172.1 TIGR04282 family arsenosugar biosynthesis glycosyltransferase [Pseudonocardia sp.]
MARAPVAGTVKTRLHPLLGAEGCARLQTALIRHAAALDGGRGFLAHTPPGAAGLIRPLVGRRLTLFPQQGADLGDRMAAAVAVAAARRPGPVILIGTDCPVLRRAHLSAAAAQLAGGCDVVLGPAYDGGYYLIALARPDPRIFALPTRAWGGPHVADYTAERAAAAGLQLGFIDPEHDLDTPADATAVLSDPRLPPEIAAMLRSGGLHPDRG